MYSVGNVVYKYVISLATYCNQIYRHDPFEMYRNTKLLCCIIEINMVLQVSYTSETNKQIHRKRDQNFCYQRQGVEWGERELDGGRKKVQTPSYKINEPQGCGAQHDKHNEHCCTSCMKVVERVNLKSSYHKENIFFSVSLFVSMR